MTKHKTISSLSIAAIALMAAAIPAVAQGQTESGKNALAATPAGEQMIASNLLSSTVRKARVSAPEVEPAAANVSRTTKPLVLSSSALKGQNNFTSATSSSRLVNPQVNFKDAGPVDPQAKKQFRTDESEISKTRQVEFVPSRGQKLPE